MSKQPESVEDWIEEERLDLWEIRYFGERLEKATQMSKRAAMDRDSLTPVMRSNSPMDFKTRIEEQLKLQRANFNQKKNLEQQNKSSIIKVAIGSALTNQAAPSKIILGSSSNIVTVGSKLPSSGLLANKKVMTTKDGKIITLQTSGNPQRFTIGKNSTVFPVSSLPKVQVTSQGNKVIKLQSVSPGSGSQRSILPRSSATTTGTVLSTPATATIIKPLNAVTTTSAPTANAGNVRPPQPIQFVRLADGQIQMKTISPSTAQQLIQRSDGKFQVMTSKSPAGNTPMGGTGPQIITTNQAPIQITQQQLKNITGLSGIKGISSGQVVKINGQQLLLRTNPDLNKTLQQQGTPTSGTATATTAIVVKEPKIISAQDSNLKAVKTPEGYAIKSIITSPPGNSPLIASNDNVPKEKPQVVSPSLSPTKQTVTSPTSLVLRVQVRMTEQGPKTIIQGLPPGSGLSKDHILAIQQQVRSMLAKCK